MDETLFNIYKMLASKKLQQVDRVLEELDCARTRDSLEMAKLGLLKDSLTVACLFKIASNSE